MKKHDKKGTKEAIIACMRFDDMVDLLGGFADDILGYVTNRMDDEEKREYIDEAAKILQLAKDSPLDGAAMSAMLFALAVEIMKQSPDYMMVPRNREVIN